jgi:hypothetical protein
MAHVGGCYSLAFSRNGMLLASGGADKTVKLWEPSTATLTSTLHVRLLDCLPVLPLLRCCCQLRGTLSSLLPVPAAHSQLRSAVLQCNCSIEQYSADVFKPACHVCCCCRARLRA